MEMVGAWRSFEGQMLGATEASDNGATLRDSKAELQTLFQLMADSLAVSGVGLGIIGHDNQLCFQTHGISQEQISSLEGFCSAIIANQGVLVVRDAKSDTRFAAPKSEPRFRFFAGKVMKNASGAPIGILFVLDGKARTDACPGEVAVIERCTSLASKLIPSFERQRLAEIAIRIVHASPEAVIAADHDQKLIYLNPAAEKIFGYSASDALGRDVSILLAEEFNQRQKRIYRSILEKGGSRLIGSFIEFEACHANGHRFPVAMSFTRWGEPGRDRGIGAVIRDLTDRKELERDRNRMGSFLDTIIQNLPAMLFVKDTDTQRYVLVNRKAESVVGRSADTMIGRTDGELFPQIGQDYQRRDALAARSSEHTVFESEFTRDDGEKRNIRTTRIVIDGPDRPGQFLLGLSEDTTEMRKVENENRKLARYDCMTGLLNRASFFDQIQKLIAVGRPFALVNIDLDRFKSINDQYGHPIGDAVLKEIAVRIDSLLRDIDVAARIGGDEFVVILTGQDLRQRAANFGQGLIERVAEPVSIDDKLVYLGVSAGIVVHPQNARTVETLREYSDLALYRAKEEGRGKVCFYDAAMDDARRQQKKLAVDLRAAIGNGDIFLQYQPIVCANTGKITCFEGLARWELDGRGMIPPSLFIPLAEDCGLIEELGQQVLHRACSDASSWQSGLPVGINLSPIQLRSGKLVPTVQEALKASGLSSSRLQLEVTERLVIDEQQVAFDTFEQLHALGIQILLDDFGVGHSALSYFQRFPFDKVKIDKSFTTEIETSHVAKSIVSSVVGLANDLSMEVVAEGVETQKQRDLLTALGCSHLQGYAIGMPVDASSAMKMGKYTCSP